MPQQIVNGQWFLEVFLCPFSNVRDTVMLMSDVVCLSQIGESLPL